MSLSTFPPVVTESTARALPAPVARFRELALREGPRFVETVAIECRATMRRPRMPRIPLRIRMFHRVGQAFVHDIRMGVGPFSFRMGLDAYVDGRGLMKIGPSVNAGVAFDQGALIALWGEALGFPSAWEGRDDVRWEPVDADTALLIVAGPEGDIPITVGFDPATGVPAFCEADRYKSNGPKVRWRGTSSDWRRFPGGVLSPGRYSAAWADEPYPWLEIQIDSVRVNVPVDAKLDEGRAILDRAARS
jgi:hypothetical protein